MKNIKGNIILSIGILLVSIAVLLNNTLSNTICDILCGIGIGLEIVGLFKECKGK